MFKPKDKVFVPFNGEGIILEANERLWGSFYVVKLTVGNAMYNKGDVETFLEKHVFLSESWEEKKINNKIDAWHKGNSNLPLHEYLGMTREEYKIFLNEPNNIATPPTA